MADFVEGEWPTYIGRIIIWFANIDAHIDSLIERCGSRAELDKYRNATLMDRAKRARALSLGAVVDDAELSAEINATFDQIDDQIERVRNHVAHPIPTFVVTPEKDGSLKLGFRRRREAHPVYMTLNELRIATDDSAALVARTRAVAARIFAKMPRS